MLVAASVLVLAMVCGGVWWSGLPRSSATNEVTATHVDTAPGRESQEQLPTKTPPDGFLGTAEWSIPIQDETYPSVSDDGVVAAVSPTGKLMAISPSGSAYLGQSIEGELTTVRMGMIAGRSSAVAVSTTKLQWLPAKGGEVKVVELPVGAQVSWAGGSPLITLDDGDRAGYLDKTGALVEVDVPQDATATAADSSGVLAIDKGGRWWKVDGHTDPTPHGLPKPDGATGAPVIVRAASSTHILAIWTTENGQIASLVSTSTKKVSTVEIGTTDLSSANPIFDRDGKMTALGPIIADLNDGLIRFVKGFDAVQIAGGRVYGRNSDNDWASVEAGQDALQVESKPATVAIPWEVTNDSAYVLDVDGGVWKVYFLKASHTTTEEK